MRGLFLVLEFLIIFAIYYGYGLISGSDLPLYALTIALIATDRVVDAVRQSFERHLKKDP